MLHKIPGRSWKSVGADILTIYNKHFLCILDFYSKFIVMKQVEGFSTGNLIKTCKIINLQYELPSKIVSDSGTNFLLKMFKNFCIKLGI